MEANEIIECLCGGDDLDTQEFVKRTLSAMKSEEDLSKKRTIMFGFLTDKTTNKTVDDELIRLLKEGIKNKIPVSEIEGIVWCLKSRDLKNLYDHQSSDLGRNIEIGKDISEATKLLKEERDNYLLFKLSAAANKRCGLIEDSDQLEKMARKIKESKQ